MNYILYLIYAVLIIGPIYLIWAIRQISKRMRKVEWLNSQEYTVLRIDVPRNNEKSPLAAEQMFAAIHGIYSDSSEFQNHLSFEIVAKDKFIQFYIHVPVHLKDFVEGQVYAQYPTVEISEVDDYVHNIDISEKNYGICELLLNKPDVYPIKQFSDFEVDPISGVTAVMSKLNPGEEVWFQVVIRPVGDNWQEKGHAMVTAVRNGAKPKGKELSQRIGRNLWSLVGAVVNQAIRPGAESTSGTTEIKLPASVEEALKSIEQKITKLGFETKIRIIALGNDPVSTRMKCQNVAAAFKQYNTTNLNGFKISEIYMNSEHHWKDYAIRSFEKDGRIFNIAELASIYHFPHMSVATPSIVWSGAKKGEPPANLPLQETTAEDELTVIGETNFRNVFRVFGIKKDDRRRHIYIVGKSGVGKSVLIENMAKDDVYKGRGVIIVDPHGELADKVLACIPENRIGDVVVFDPADREFPVAFNLLESIDDDFKPIVASGFVGIFKKLFDKSWGPRLEHIMRNTVLALLDVPGSTMLDIPRMLTNNHFRDRIVEKVKDPIIREFWQNEFASFDAKFRTEAVSPILNKVGQFLASSTIRNIVGQPRSTINIREIMDQKKIMIVNLSRGKIGEDNSALLGAMMITKIQLAAMSRADVTVDNRPDTYLYVDEFQNFATDSFAVILAEARKYNLNLTMAHQYIAQLKDEVREAVFGNAGTIISFRVGGADASTLVKEFEPVFVENDLVNLDKFNIYVKLLVDGISSPAFSARTLPPVDKLTGNVEKVIAQSHEKYSSPRTVVEDIIAGRSAEEEAALKQEAEVFKKGGLEALLLKKNSSPSTAQTHPLNSAPRGETRYIAPVAAAPVKPAERPAEASLNVVPSSPPNNIDKPAAITVTSDISGSVSQEGSSAQAMSVVSDAEEENEKVKEGPKTVKLENILNGRLYKERTARGGIKWFLGEEIDEEKLAKSHILIDEKGREMIELSKKVSSDKPVGQSKRQTHQPQQKSDTRVDQKQASESGKGEVEKQGSAINITVAPEEKKDEPKAVESVVEEKPLMPMVRASDLPEIKEDLSPTPANDLTTIHSDASKIEPQIIQQHHSSSSVASAGQPVTIDPQHLSEGQEIKLPKDE
ncbi:MAG: type IV secretion system DNA-binding domain-containing protein [Patescibacteria group bacterium]